MISIPQTLHQPARWFLAKNCKIVSTLTIDFYRIWRITKLITNRQLEFSCMCIVHSSQKLVPLKTFCWVQRFEIKVILLDVILDWRSVWIEDPGYYEFDSDILVLQSNSIGKPIVIHGRSLEIMIWEPNLTSIYDFVKKNQSFFDRSKTGERCAMTLEVSGIANTSPRSTRKLFYICTSCDT